MSRSVSTHSNAFETVYLHPEFEDGDEDAWDSFIEDLVQVLAYGAMGKRSGFPSFSEVKNRWQGREDRIILENQRAEVSVAEYNGLVSVCLAPRDTDNQLDVGWCKLVGPTFVKLLHKAYKDSALVSQGRASNGEQFFAPINRPEGCVTSKEGVLW